MALTSRESGEILSVLKMKREQFLKDQSVLHRQQVRERMNENTHMRQIQTFQPQMILRKPFLPQPSIDQQYFEKSKQIFFPHNPAFKDVDITKYMLPARSKDPKGRIGFRKAPLDLFGNPDTSLMGRDEKRRYQLWEEIRRQREQEQAQTTFQSTDGKQKKVVLDSLHKKVKIFLPSDTKIGLFTSNPSSVYDTPRTPRSTRKLVSLSRNVEHDLKWNPNNSSEGIFDRDVFKEYHRSLPHAGVSF